MHFVPQSHPAREKWCVTKRVVVFEDWCPTEQSHVEVSLMLDPPMWRAAHEARRRREPSFREEYVPLYRVCVWGGDDFGLELDTPDYGRALRAFQVIGDGITQNALRELGFVNA